MKSIVDGGNCKEDERGEEAVKEGQKGARKEH